jgi:endonuclease/exonuclease/phosphatase family metal-dependent hydrolase
MSRIRHRKAAILETRAVLIRALTWNVFHGRDFPPNPALRTRRSRVWRATERDGTHAQVNRSLRREFGRMIAEAEWDVALFQEFPPRWARDLAADCEAVAHRELTSRNSLAPLRAIATWINPDLIGSNEGGSNLTLVRPAVLGGIAERRLLVLAPGPQPERRTMAFTRTEAGVCIANLHASTGPSNRARAEAELRVASERSLRWAAGAPLIFGGDLNVRPRESGIYDELAARFGLASPTAPDSLDHLLVTGLATSEPPAPWAVERREIAWRNGLRVRLSDHAPVSATFERAG